MDDTGQPPLWEPLPPRPRTDRLVSALVGIWASGWLVVCLLVLLDLGPLGELVCYVEPDTPDCARQPAMTMTCIVVAALWLVVLILTGALPALRRRPAARRMVWLLAPPLLTLALVAAPAVLKA